MIKEEEPVSEFIPEMIGREIEKATHSIYRLQNVFICKVKILKSLKFDLGKLMELCDPYSYSLECMQASNARPIVACINSCRIFLLLSK